VPESSKPEGERLRNLIHNHCEVADESGGKSIMGCVTAMLRVEASALSGAQRREFGQILRGRTRNEFWAERAAWMSEFLLQRYKSTCRRVWMMALRCAMFMAVVMPSFPLLVLTEECFELALRLYGKQFSMHRKKSIKKDILKHALFPVAASHPEIFLSALSGALPSSGELRVAERRRLRERSVMIADWIFTDPIRILIEEHPLLVAMHATHFGGDSNHGEGKCPADLGSLFFPRQFGEEKT
jgi:hypothetical protein